jgi:FkbM family methyltransferase
MQFHPHPRHFAPFLYHSGYYLNQSNLMTIEPYGTYAPRGILRGILNTTRKLPNNWLGKRVSFLLRRFGIMALKGSPVDITVLGAHMRLFPYNNVCEKRILFTPQYFDADELSILKSRMKPNFHFIDIGANIGGYTLFVAANAGQGARILAIEPQADIFARLSYNISRNPFGTVKAFCCAIADKDGKLTLFVDPNNRGESSVKIVSGDRGAGNVKVPVKRLLSILQEEGFTRLDAAKLDVEGAEDLILDTFFKEAPEPLWPLLLIIERGNARWSIDIPALLLKQGYNIIATTKNNQIYERNAHA